MRRKLLALLLMLVLALSGCVSSSLRLPTPTPAPTATPKPSASHFSDYYYYGYDVQSTWGDLFAEYGVVYGTLTSAQRNLVHFPRLSLSCVYYVPGGKSFHSVSWCYTLNKSKDIRHTDLYGAIDRGLVKCSKCVR